MEKMGAILLIHWTFRPTTGGVESHIADLAHAMAARGCRVVVLTGEEKPLISDRYSIISTSLLELATIKKNPIPESDYFYLFKECLEKIIVTHQVRTIHGHNLHHFHSAPALAVEAIRKQYGVRVFHTFHETWPDLLREEPVYRSWNGNYAVSRHVQQECESRLGFSPALRLLGVNTETFRSKTECFTSGLLPTIFHPARLLPWKGVEISVRALAMLRERGHPAKLVLTDTQRIADWDDELIAYRERILNLIVELRVTSLVRFETASYADMPGLYESADIVVYPTIGDEPYGLVPIEAMSCARPIIASVSGGIPETVADGITGYLVPRGNPEELASRIAGLISDPRQARNLGAAGRHRAELLFDARRYVSALLDDFAEA
jgi:glycosyltransferase involved in cell wall biosynthesis